MGNKNQLFKKIAEYYSGNADNKAIKNDLVGDKESKRIFNWIDSFWHNLNPTPNHHESIKNLTDYKIKQGSRSFAFLYSKPFKYAATIIILLGISSIFFIVKNQTINEIYAESGIGEVKEIVLPDGTKAWLNAKSSISYPEEFKGNYRKVCMDGEIYFEVTKDKNHPFIVESELITIKVLGTSFMVSSYCNEPKVNTYLAEGSIELGLKSNDTKMLLIPGEEAIYTKKTHNVNKRYNPHSVMDSWRYGKISFYNESFFEIARKLERKFGKEIEISSPEIGNMKFTSDFETESLDQIMEFFSIGAGIKYTKNDNKYIITKNE